MRRNRNIAAAPLRSANGLLLIDEYDVPVAKANNNYLHIRDTAKVLIILSISFLLVAAEDALTTAITFSALIAIMFIGIGLQKKESGSGKKALGKIRKALGGS